MGEGPLAGLPATARDRVSAFARAVARSACAQAEMLGFRTWLAAARVPGRVTEELGVDHTTFRAALRLELRALLTEAWPGREMDPVRPDVVVHAVVERAAAEHAEGGAAAFASARAEFEAHPVYVAGRYRKEVRGLSQTVFHCRVCRGKRRRYGSTCDACDGTGRMVPESVEDFVRPAIEAMLAGSGSAFHGSGREDVDVRMLGSGRPFVVSVEGPRRWALSAAAVADIGRMVREESAGRVTVGELRIVDREERRRITTVHGEKVYEALVRPGEGELPADAAARMVALAGTTIDQRTPQRVDARRADMVRERRVRELSVVEADPRELRLRVVTDPGLYVKELVSGDDGRTVPSVTSVLGLPCTCVELDVVDVRDAASAS